LERVTEAAGRPASAVSALLFWLLGLRPGRLAALALVSLVLWFLVRCTEAYLPPGGRPTGRPGPRLSSTISLEVPPVSSCNRYFMGTLGYKLQRWTHKISPFSCFSATKYCQSKFNITLILRILKIERTTKYSGGLGIALQNHISGTAELRIRTIFFRIRIRHFLIVRNRFLPNINFVPIFSD
jgi:hypothetical protein